MLAMSMQPLTSSGQAPGLLGRSIPQELLDIEDKTRSNLFAWRGQFSPQLVEVLLETYAPPRGVVVDPFVGSGTVLIEAARLGLRAVGAEVNPAAALMAATYRLMGSSKRRRLDIVARIDRNLAEHAGRALPLFSSQSDQAADPSTFLRQLLADAAGHPDDQQVLRALIVTANFATGAIAFDRLLSAWANLKQRILSLPYSRQSVQIHLADARALPIDDATADIVVTSPPYINVFNYHQQYRPAIEFLGYDVLAAARSEIGANRKHRQNRFLTVIQYCLDMAQVIEEMTRVAKPGAPVLLVVGRESNVRKTAFYNAEIVSSIATRCIGLKEHTRLERSFCNKFGQRIFEDILCFESARADKHSTDIRKIALTTLKQARQRAPEESRADLDEALERVGDVLPSPFFDARKVTPGVL